MKPQYIVQITTTTNTKIQVSVHVEYFYFNDEKQKTKNMLELIRDGTQKPKNEENHLQNQE